NLFVPPSTISQHAPISVQDGTGRNKGASKRWATLLTDTGLVAGDGGSTRLSPTTQVVDSSGGRYSATASWLAQYFGVQVTTVPAPRPAPPPRRPRPRPRRPQPARPARAPRPRRGRARPRNRRRSPPRPPDPGRARRGWSSPRRLVRGLRQAPPSAMKTSAEASVDS